MRNHEVIEREMFRAREDLEQSVAELKHIVQEKLDVKARAKVAFERGVGKAYDAFERGKQQAVEGARDLAVRGKSEAVDLYYAAKERPVITGAIVAGVIATGVLVYVAAKKDWF